MSVKIDEQFKKDYELAKALVDNEPINLTVAVLMMLLKGEEVDTSDERISSIKTAKSLYEMGFRDE